MSELRLEFLTNCLASTALQSNIKVFKIIGKLIITALIGRKFFLRQFVTEYDNVAPFSGIDNFFKAMILNTYISSSRGCLRASGGHRWVRGQIGG